MAIALFAGPASWMLVHAQADPASTYNGVANTAIPVSDSHSTSNTVNQNVKNGSVSEAGSSSSSASPVPSDKSSVSALQSTQSSSKNNSQSISSSKSLVSPNPIPATSKSKATPPSVTTPVATSAVNHNGITSTIFWVGEPADTDNDNITNTVSAWDESWQAHYGGVDDPHNRNAYVPAAFAPKENSFYFALPYSDFTDNGDRKASAGNCPNAAALANSSASWCKNAWIKIIHNGKTTYAQWEDVGPLQEDDTPYVFGSSPPKNTWGAKAGIDVSPAVRDYLGLQDVDSVSWSFVNVGSVPAGPWKTTVTSSLGT